MRLMNMNPILLASYDYEMTATRLQQDLSASGIDCVVEKVPKTSAYDAMIDHSSFCFAVYVDHEDYTQAKEILKQFNATRDEETPWCPKCGSHEVTKTVVHHEHGPNWLWYLFPSPIASSLFFEDYDEEDYHCNSCGHDFKRY